MKTTEERKLTQKRNEELCCPKFNIENAQELLELNNALIEYVVSKYSFLVTHLYDIDDMKQSARIGLIRAATLYDKNKGNFSTYACIWIKRYILSDCFGERALIAIPDSVLRLYDKLQKKYQCSFSDPKFFVELDADKALRKEDKERIRLMASAGNIMSLDVSETDKEKNNVEDLAVPAHDNTEQEAVDNVYDMQILSLVFSSKLKEKERWVIAHRFGIGGKRQLSLEECAIRFPWGQRTKERIRQIEAHALKTLSKDERLKKCVKDIF